MIINCWQNIPSPHQSACLRALAALGHEVHLFVEQGELPERRAMGWVRPDFGDVRITVAPDDVAVADAVERGIAGNACHLISGLRSAPLCARAFDACRARSARVGLLAEPGDPRGVKGLLRRGIYAWDARRLRHYIDFILAMGQTGVDWYTKAGYPPRKVFHFGYVVETPTCDAAPPRQQNTRIVYVGSLIKLKGVELLLRALASSPDQSSWHLDLIGDGPERAALQQLAATCGIGARVHFHGIVPMAAVTRELAHADLLVLPSRGDGWGAVVNEALMCGVPVICSDQCGAADLLCASWRGEVFRSGSVAALQRALRPRLEQGPLAPATRAHIRTWSHCITGESMARYLLAVLAHVYANEARPLPPWHVSEDVACEAGK